MLQKTLNTRILLSELEGSINFWRNVLPSDQHTMKLCKQASVLAEVYAICIINNQEFIDPSDLTLEQLKLLRSSD